MHGRYGNNVIDFQTHLNYTNITGCSLSKLSVHQALYSEPAPISASTESLTGYILPLVLHFDLSFVDVLQDNMVEVSRGELGLCQREGCLFHHISHQHLGLQVQNFVIIIAISDHVSTVITGFC